MAFGQLNKRCKDGSRLPYEDEIRSVEVGAAEVDLAGRSRVETLDSLALRRAKDGSRRNRPHTSRDKS